MGERILAHFATRDWGAIAEILADNYSNDDRRRVVGAGVRNGRDAQIADMRATAELWAANVTWTVMATRGGNLVLTRLGFSDRDEGPEAFLTEVLSILEINDDERMVALVTFDPDDIDAAIAELDARYLAGQAAAHAHTWSLVADAFAAINRHELPARTPDWVNVDHRRGAAFAAGEMTAYIHDLFDDVRDIHVYAEVVHRLGNLGAVITQAGHGTSQEGFQAEWREIGIFMFDGDLLSHYELFDEADLDAALARFDELHSQARRLENAATRTVEQFFAHFAVRDWDAMAELLADDVSADDRRSVVNAGIRRGRDARDGELACHRRHSGPLSVRSTVATRGERLALVRFSLHKQGRWASGVFRCGACRYRDQRQQPNRGNRRDRSRRRRRRVRGTRRSIPRRRSGRPRVARGRS